MKILIADDHAVLREGVRQVLSTLPSVTLIDDADNGNIVLSKLKKNKYDLMILDISIPGISGLDILQHIKDAGLECRVIILSFHPEEQYANRAFKLGAVGYISKNSSFAEIKKAIEKVATGGRYVSPDFAEKLAFNENANLLPHERLSEREFQVMIMLSQGKSISEIASHIFIADKTVSTYRARIMEKMEMSSNAELTMYSMRAGLIS